MNAGLGLGECLWEPAAHQLRNGFGKLRLCKFIHAAKCGGNEPLTVLTGLFMDDHSLSTEATLPRADGGVPGCPFAAPLRGSTPKMIT